MNDKLKSGFLKGASSVTSVSKSFGKSLRGSAFAKPSKTVTVSTPKFGLSKGNAGSGYNSGGTASVGTNQY